MVGAPHPKSVDAVVAVVVVKQGLAHGELAVLAHCATAVAGLKFPMRAEVVETRAEDSEREAPKAAV